MHRQHGMLLTCVAHRTDTHAGCCGRQERVQANAEQLESLQQEMEQLSMQQVRRPAAGGFADRGNSFTARLLLAVHAMPCHATPCCPSAEHCLESFHCSSLSSWLSCPTALQ